MPDIIRLLPDSVANQIAAGEVVQRPASAVKELLENAIDSGANFIELHVKDAGKTLIQVIDNGCGMSVTDARKSFERHATSKIKDANDLYAIYTFGFRGEALASIAAIAQVELKSRRIEDELGTSIQIEGTTIINQEACSCPAGTNIQVKNIYFNVPARRNFLKSDQVEFNHILEEFLRVAIIYPETGFFFTHNGKTIFRVEKANLKQRIVALFGSSFNQKLFPIEQKMDNLTIYGFVAKPEFARKTRGEQYFFVNRRFMKHPYLHHAIDGAFEQLVPEKSFPVYFINFDVDPASIDVNIHPTKTEIKFLDEKLIYAVLRSTIKQALGKNNLTPTLDFEVEQSFDQQALSPGYIPKQPTIRINPDYNPFRQTQETSFRKSERPQGWENFFEKPQPENRQESLDSEISIPENKSFESFFSEIPEQLNLDQELEIEESMNYPVFQFQQKYIISSIKSGLLVIDQQRAYERILYEQLLQHLENQKNLIQQQLFPQTLVFSTSDSELILSLLDEIQKLGFDIREFGSNTFVVYGTPADLPESDIKLFMEETLENYRLNLPDLRQNSQINLALSMARNLSSRMNKRMMPEEMHSTIAQLFGCVMPEFTPAGKKIFIKFTLGELLEKFK